MQRYVSVKYINVDKPSAAEYQLHEVKLPPNTSSDSTESQFRSNFISLSKKHDKILLYEEYTTATM